MLVLSRRPDQHFSFPDLDIHVKVLGVRGDVVKVGIQAPDRIRVVRSELESSPSSPIAPAGDRVKFLTRKQLHDLKNKLNSLNLAMRLYQRQHEIGLHSKAGVTLERILEQSEWLRKEFAALEHVVPSRKERPIEEFGVSCRTLLVEDDSNERELLAGFLRMNGFEVATANDGLEALKFLGVGEKCDLVLLDMCMPRMDGKQTIETIRRNPDRSDLKVFAVSGSEPSSFGVITGPGGVDRWFPKPLNPEELIREIRRTTVAALSA